jgi:hypothetical protein
MVWSLSSDTEIIPGSEAVEVSWNPLVENPHLESSVPITPEGRVIAERVEGILNNIQAECGFAVNLSHMRDLTQAAILTGGQVVLGDASSPMPLPPSTTSRLGLPASPPRPYTSEGLGGWEDTSDMDGRFSPERPLHHHHHHHHHRRSSFKDIDSNQVLQFLFDEKRTQQRGLSPLRTDAKRSRGGSQVVPPT